MVMKYTSVNFFKIFKAVLRLEENKNFYNCFKIWFSVLYELRVTLVIIYIILGDRAIFEIVSAYIGANCSCNKCWVCDCGCGETSIAGNAIPDKMFIYGDICLPGIVEDTQVPILRIITLDAPKYEYGKNTVRHLSPPHYVPCLHCNKTFNQF